MVVFTAVVDADPVSLVVSSETVALVVAAPVAMLLSAAVAARLVVSSETVALVVVPVVSAVVVARRVEIDRNVKPGVVLTSTNTLILAARGRIAAAPQRRRLNISTAGKPRHV